MIPLNVANLAEESQRRQKELAIEDMKRKMSYGVLPDVKFNILEEESWGNYLGMTASFGSMTVKLNAKMSLDEVTGQTVIGISEKWILGKLKDNFLGDSDLTYKIYNHIVSSLEKDFEENWRGKWRLKIDPEPDPTNLQQ